MPKTENSLQNQGKKELITQPYIDVLDKIVSATTEYFSIKGNNTFRSLYVRGSVAVGKARPPLSDIDVILITEQASGKKTRDYYNQVVTDIVSTTSPDITEVDLTICTLEDLLYNPEIKNLKIYMKYQSVLLKGEELLNKLPAVYPGPQLALCMYEGLEQEFDSLYKQFSSLGEPKTYQGRQRQNSFWCVWLMRTILRSAMGLVMFEERILTQDLQECNIRAKKYYPSLAVFLDQALELAVNPTDDTDFLLDFMDKNVSEYIELWRNRRQQWLQASVN